MILGTNLSPSFQSARSVMSELRLTWLGTGFTVMSKKALSAFFPCYHTEITVHCVCAEVDYRGSMGGAVIGWKRGAG